ncbi:MBL fold metallo-hydrolase [Oleiagrimonas sp.]|jgi:glyoxylase-like metal-dependent hydrolase (beta-lactamase superfamily II)|uniref:MBL fold metallo-hydrolase n=1 Tax=Oleiagrimonas sp. TaxID=2010330 RepID=UPI00261065EA|nr:MBL fold metallo-hydrolase [Oleiagrimonas sp.]MDA3914692.1 MBL fold metallo-hydrolase [Oleiagrimonas sp.]
MTSEQPKAPVVRDFFDDDSNTFSYVVSDPQTGRAAVIDSVLEYDPASGSTSHAGADRIVAYVRERKLEVEWVIDTHVHADHLSAAPYIKDQLGGTLGIGEHISAVQDVFGKLFNAGSGFARDGSQFDHLFHDGETYAIGSIQAMALHTPGHTPACMTHVIGDAAFVGDTLFMPDYGTARCDFPGGDAHALYRSIQRLFELPQSTRVFLCHDYKPEGRDAYVNQTSIDAERRENIHVHVGVGEEDFVTMRTARDAKLSMPHLILPAVQVNMRAGLLPPPESNGMRYLKIPLNAFKRV